MRSLLSITFLMIVSALGAAEPEKVRVLIIDGQNNHSWATTTPILIKQFATTNRFDVKVATSPPVFKAPAIPKDANPEDAAKIRQEIDIKRKEHQIAMEKFHPDLSAVDVIVSNYNGEPWGSAFNNDLDLRLKEGKVGLVIVHAANNAFPAWKEYNQMIGMGWRVARFGNRIKYDDTGKPTMAAAGEDQDSGHRYTGPFTVTVRNFEHPITKGIQPEWLHARDELYDNMRGPIANITMLATAYSKGTMTHEPMVWTVKYGKGRVFHTPMGHDANAMRRIGFGVILNRGTEWAATGSVTLPIPKVFPTADKIEQIPEK